MPYFLDRASNKQLLDRDTALFLDILADNLLSMSRAIDVRINELTNKACNTTANGFVLASIETPSMLLGIKYEYVEYIKRFGPPIKGKFDENLLESLRKELNMLK
jgi:hypothetical protein